VEQPRWPTQAHRAVYIQRRVQAVSMAFLQPVMMGDSPFVLRGLQPAEDRITLDRSRQSMAELTQTIEAMGKIVAWGQLRSSGREGSAITDELIQFGQDKAWRETLLGVSDDCVRQVHADFATFKEAFDDQEFT
jgi:uncharacterized protein (DUF2252 family)